MEAGEAVRPFPSSITYLDAEWTFTGRTDTRYLEIPTDAYMSPVGEYQRADGSTLWAHDDGEPFYDEIDGVVVIPPSPRSI